jgi:hypothetical protein
LAFALFERSNRRHVGCAVVVWRRRCGGRRGCRRGARLGRRCERTRSRQRRRAARLRGRAPGRRNGPRRQRNRAGRVLEPRPVREPASRRTVDVRPRQRGAETRARHRRRQRHPPHAQDAPGLCIDHHVDVPVVGIDGAHQVDAGASRRAPDGFKSRGPDDRQNLGGRQPRNVWLRPDRLPGNGMQRRRSQACRCSQQRNDKSPHDRLPAEHRPARICARGGLVLPATNLTVESGGAWARMRAFSDQPDTSSPTRLRRLEKRTSAPGAPATGPNHPRTSAERQRAMRGGRNPIARCARLAISCCAPPKRAEI